MNIMKTENKIEDLISKKLNHSINAGFTNPPADYFQNFADRLPLHSKVEVKTRTLKSYRNVWFRAGSMAIAAMLLIALWIFVFDANIKKDTNGIFTVEELLALNDFQNYNEDMIFSEMATASDTEINSNDAEINALMDMDGLSSDEIIELYSKEY